MCFIRRGYGGSNNHQQTISRHWHDLNLFYFDDFYACGIVIDIHEPFCQTITNKPSVATDRTWRLHLLGANWRPWHLKLKLSLSHNGGLHGTSCHPVWDVSASGGLSCTRLADFLPPWQYNRLGRCRATRPRAPTKGGTSISASVGIPPRGTLLECVRRPQCGPCATCFSYVAAMVVETITNKPSVATDRTWICFILITDFYACDIVIDIHEPFCLPLSRSVPFNQ